MIRVGILDSSLARGHGGVHQYTATIVEGLSRHRDIEVVVCHDDPAKREVQPQRAGALQLPGDETLFHRGIRTVATMCDLRAPWLGRFEPLRRERFDCLISSASLIGFHLRIPFIGIVYDVMYKYFPGLAEYPWRVRVARDLIARKFDRHAQLTVVDSQRCKDDLIRFYGAAESRIRAIPLSPPPHVAAAVAGADLSSLSLPERFLLYPAQLWEHKNHRRLLEALAQLRREGVDVPLVLVGSHQERAGLLRDWIRELDLDQQVRYLGYVDNSTLVALYRRAAALIFASFGDYTNIPVLEAMALGTPVICSSAFAMPEQVGDAGVLFDPFSVTEIAEAIRRVWCDADLRRQLTERGHRRVAAQSLEQFGNAWHRAVTEAVGG